MHHPKNGRRSLVKMTLQSGAMVDTGNGITNSALGSPQLSSTPSRQKEAT
jgi:hypothetical protein